MPPSLPVVETDEAGSRFVKELEDVPQKKPTSDGVVTAPKGTTIETKSNITAKGEVVFNIPTPQNGLYYQLDFTLNNTTTGRNGVAQVSKVVYTN